MRLGTATVPDYTYVPRAGEIWYSSRCSQELERETVLHNNTSQLNYKQTRRVTWECVTVLSETQIISEWGSPFNWAGRATWQVLKFVRCWPGWAWKGWMVKRKTRALKTEAAGDERPTEDPVHKTSRFPRRLQKCVGSWLLLEISDLFMSVPFVDE